MRTTIFVSLIALLAGLGVGRYSTQRNLDEARHALGELEQSQQNLKNDLARFASIDLNEIEKIQDAEERAKRLSELVGELFMVLLNHALIPAGKRVVESREAPATGDTKATTDVPAKELAGSEVEQAALNAIPESAPEPVTSSEAESPGKPVTKSWASAETELSKLTAAQADAFLSKVAITDLTQEMRNSRPHAADDPRLDAIQGSFSGTLNFIDKKRSQYTIELEVHGRDVVRGKLQGSYEIRIFRDGQKFGTTKGSGDLQIFNTQGESQALVIRGSPEEFFQVYALADGQTLIGNYYEVLALQEPKLIGRVRLLRN